MTSMLCLSAALDRVVAPWAAKIAVFFAIIVEILVAIAESIHDTVQELRACYRRPGRRLLALCHPTVRLWRARSVLLRARRSPAFERFSSLCPRGLRESRQALSPRSVPEAKDIERYERLSKGN